MGDLFERTGTIMFYQGPNFEKRYLTKSGYVIWQSRFSGSWEVTK